MFMYFANVVPYHTGTGNYKMWGHKYYLKHSVSKDQIKEIHDKILSDMPKPDLVYVNGEILSTGNYSRVPYKPILSDYCHGFILDKNGHRSCKELLKEHDDHE